jgi:hypothetical protein
MAIDSWLSINWKRIMSRQHCGSWQAITRYGTLIRRGALRR